MRRIEFGVVVYGCVSSNVSVEDSKAESEKRFAVDLLDELARVDGRLKSRARRSDLSVLRSPLGQPLLRVDGVPGPAMSMSRTPGLLWGAVSAGPAVGIDVASRNDFVGRYPYHRAFGPEELTLATGCIGHDLPSVAAGLWAIKEAAVKAVGTGFHGFDPRDVRVRSLDARAGGYLSHVRVGLTCPVWLSSEGAGWLALAVVL
ncbi:MAG: 4'-phosphopantetheinyl transferase superfamily protein [Syntrophobacteraceae bacterium]